MIKFEEYRSKKPVETTKKILSPLEIPKAIFLYDAQRGKAKGLKDQWKHNYIKNTANLYGKRKVVVGGGDDGDVTCLELDGQNDDAGILPEE
ncbi:hypothetical protein E4U14_000995 [Claviceps sp. LM454 group G7]|nr:hypothetical protein E4U14_000995 [Claviceps sp. LM454 group G7]